MKDQSFEEALKRLEEVVELLEDGHQPLEEALELYAEGVLTARHCHGILKKARQRIETLTAENGETGDTVEGGVKAQDGIFKGPGGKGGIN